MGFIRKAAQIGTFGLAGLALSKKHKDKPQQTQPSLIAKDTTGVSTPSLISSSSPSIY